MKMEIIYYMNVFRIMLVRGNVICVFLVIFLWIRYYFKVFLIESWKEEEENKYIYVNFSLFCIVIEECKCLCV